MEYGSNHYIDKRSSGMAIASLVLGIVGVVLGWCVYPGMIFGSLAIILALLSRGGEMTTSSMGKAGITLGSIALVIGIFTYIISMVIMFSTYGGMDGYMNSVDEILEQTYPEYPGMYDDTF